MEWEARVCAETGGRDAPLTDAHVANSLSQVGSRDILDAVLGAHDAVFGYITVSLV